MGIWFGMVLITSVFTGLYFMYGAEQIARMMDTPTVAADILKACHNAAVVEARANPALGGSSAQRECTDTGASALTTSMADGLNVPEVVIRFHPGTEVGLSSGRIVVTYLPDGGTINGIIFNDVLAQVGARFHGDPSVGRVTSATLLETSSGIDVTVPAAVPVGALAMVTTVEP